MRTTTVEVKTLLNSTLSNAIVDTFINDANALVTEVLSGSGLSSTLLASIEKWLAAHLIAMSPYERQASKVKIDDAEETYGKTGLRLDATTYGQMVLTLDSSGNFADIGKKPVIMKAITSFS